VARVLRERRDQVGREWFAKVNPLDRFRIEQGTVLAFDDLAVLGKLAGAGSTVDPAPARHEVTIETRRGKKGFGPAVRIQLERGDGARASSPSGGEHRERARISPCPTIHLGETGQKIAWPQDTGMIYASLLVLSIVYPH